MIRQFSFTASSLLAILGTILAISGIMGESFKTVLIGFVLIFSAGVFATLYLGARNLT